MKERKSIIDYEKLKEEQQAHSEEIAENNRRYNEQLKRENNELVRSLLEAYENNRQKMQEKDEARLEAAIEEAKREAETKTRREWQKENHTSAYYAQTEHEQKLTDAYKELSKALGQRLGENKND